VTGVDGMPEPRDDQHRREAATEGADRPALLPIPPFPGVRVEICTGPPSLPGPAAAALLRVLLQARPDGPGTEPDGTGAETDGTTTDPTGTDTTSGEGKR